MMQTLIGTGANLTCEAVDAFAESSGTAAFTESATPRIAESHTNFMRHTATGIPIYGTNTGFGPHVVTQTSGGEAQGAALIAHLGAGFGSAAPNAVVRATMLLRLHTVGQGYSGASPNAVTAYRDLLHSGVFIAVPETGSVGASGDLVPLSHIARVLMESLPLSGRDALALVNGTSFTTAYAALAVARTTRLLTIAETLTGWLYRLLGARPDALGETLNTLRGHPAQAESAANIRREAERFGANYADDSRPLQEVYSIRCAPQVLGAIRTQIAYARSVIEAEINGVDDNPVITETGVLHGGNFHAQAVAFAADALNAAVTQIAVLAERQIALLCTPSQHNDFAPLLLAFEPGRDSGLAGAQITATALVAEMRGSCQCYAVSSIPTNADNQDVVPMATLAAQAAYRQIARLSGVLAVLHIALCQLDFLRHEHKATGKASPAPPHFPAWQPLRADRALYDDIRRVAETFLTDSNIAQVK